MSEVVKQIEVTWTEETAYTYAFEVGLDEADWEGFDIGDMSEVHELLDDQGAWDQVTKDGWLSPVAVHRRTVDNAKEVDELS